MRPIISSTSFRTIVRTTIDLAHQLGVKVVAEGVESAAISSELRALGCDIGQGFYLGRPMSAAAFTEWMRDPARLVVRLEASGYPQLIPAAPGRIRAGWSAGPPAARSARLRRVVQRVGGGTLAFAALMLAVYGLWQVFRWGGREHQALIGDLAFVPVNGAAVVLAWRVSRRAELGRHTCRAWRLLSVAMFLYLLGDLLQFCVRERAAPPGLPDLGRRGVPELLRGRLLRPRLLPRPPPVGTGAVAAAAGPGHGVHRRGGADLVPGARPGHRVGPALRPVRPRHLRLPGR